MKNRKSQLYVVLVLVAGAIAVLLFDRNTNPSRSELEGTPLVAPEIFASVTGISVTKGEKTIALTKLDNGFWQVKEGTTEFPADGKKISNMFDQFAKLKFQRLIGKKGTIGVGMESPVKVEFQGKEGNKAFLIGDRRTGGGQYISVDGSEDVFLTNETAEISSDFDHWELKILADVKKDLIKSVEMASTKKGQAAIILSREKAEDKLVVTGLSKNEKTRDSNLSQLERGLESLAFSKRVDPSNEEARTALTGAVTSKFTLFDGRIYHVSVGKVGKDTAEKFYLKIVADKGTAALSTEQQAELDLLNRVASQWHFEVAAYVGKKFLKERSDLVEAEKS